MLSCKEVIGMKTLTAFVLAFILGAPAYAGLWETKCASCHNGAVAPSKKSLLEKYKTPDAFMSAVRKAVLNGKMSRGLGYRFVAKELYGRFPTLQCRQRCRNCGRF
jgi:hypothetical protein